MDALNIEELRKDLDLSNETARNTSTAFYEEKSFAKKRKPISQHEKMRRDLSAFLRLNNLALDWRPEWNDELPKKWKIAQDLLILPANCFTSQCWIEFEAKSDRLWKTLAECFKVNRIAKENRVKPDDFRSPNLTLLYGNDSVVTVNNNGIKYSYDINKCMFSWGNITEKLRIASFDCSKEIVVDLFAGIGYFTLVYLVHAKAKQVIACEWNPASVEALKRNLKLNKCEERCQVLLGDNRDVCAKNCANRVNLGLIPSSEISWKTACDALRLDTGGYLHIHGNVDIKLCNNRNKHPKQEWSDWAEYTQNKIRTLLEQREKSLKWNVTIEHIEYVKSYGPRVDHLVLDLLCKPIS